MKLQAIFSDYDGTLCPLELPREDAYIQPRLHRLLTKISKSIKIGIITTKDITFIRDKVPFAQGIAATCGLEIQIGDKIIQDPRMLESNGKIEVAYKEALATTLPIRDKIMIERKETDGGRLIAFSVDWRFSRDWAEARRKTAALLSFCKEQGLEVVESEVSPFFNVFPFKVEKGTAFQRLRNEIGVTSPIMYLGDSEVDNPAFQIADISVGIKHPRVMPPLQCKFRVEFLELENFLSSLIEVEFDFHEGIIQANTAYS